MNFYETFKPEAESLVGELYAAKVQLTTEIKSIRDSLELEKINAAGLQPEIASLKSNVASQLTGQRSDFEAYKEKLQTLQSDYNLTAELIQATQDTVLPQKQKELDTVTQTAKNKLIGLLRSKRQIADDEVNALLEQYIVKVGQFETDFQQIFRDYGLSINFYDETLYCGCMAQAEIATFKYRIETERRRRALLNPTKQPTPEPAGPAEQQDPGQPQQTGDKQEVQADGEISIEGQGQESAGKPRGNAEALAQWREKQKAAKANPEPQADTQETKNLSGQEG